MHYAVVSLNNNVVEYNTKASTAWDFSPDLGISGINLGFRDFSKQSWDFYGSRKFTKILVNCNFKP